jgi:hypothetical protein
VFLHVANGHCTTDLIERSGVQGRTIVWCDPLHDGPVPGDVTDEELLRVRARFLASSPDAVDDVVSDLARSRAAVDHVAAYDELVLWFEHDLFDQLNLIHLLTHIGRRQQLSKPMSLISIDRHPNHQDFKGLGELTPGEIAALFPARAPITGDQIAIAEHAWTAFRSPDRGAIDAFLQTDSTALPFLASALERHLEEFPSDREGLSRSERRLMELAINGPVELRQLFPRMHDGERAFYITDTALKDRARELAGLAPPLVLLAGDDPLLPLSGTVALTAEGRAVLNGSANRVLLCGIDRWLGGVRLLR